MADTTQPLIQLVSVSKSFGNFTAVDNVSIDIHKGEFFALLGGSGCGKTTLLRMLAGFETPSSGTIFIDGKDMTQVPAYERPVNMMFQSYALFPHMTVAKNVGYGLKRESISNKERQERVAHMLSLVQMSELADRKPEQLSGGQRQRVALARALAREPKVLLLDEPLGALDKKLREQTQFEISNIQCKTGITFVVVTHDQDEAMVMASRVAVMNKGTIAQIDTPARIYEHPRNRFVAEFIGSVNIFEGTVCTVASDYIEIETVQPGIRLRAQCRQLPQQGANIAVAVRPEKIALSREKPVGTANTLRGVVTDLGYFGKDSLYKIKTETGMALTVSVVNAHRFEETTDSPTWDDMVWLSFSDSAVILLT